MAGMSPEKCPLFQFLCPVLTEEKMAIVACLAAALTDLLGRNPVLLFVWIYCLEFRDKCKITRNPSLPLLYDLALVETLEPTGTFQIRKILSFHPSFHSLPMLLLLPGGTGICCLLRESQNGWGWKECMEITWSYLMHRKAAQWRLLRTTSRWFLNVTSFSVAGLTGKSLALLPLHFPLMYL